MMHGAGFVVVALTLLAVVIIAGLAKWWVAPRTEARRALKAVRNVPIGEVKHGARVKVTGVVEALGPQMQSPIDRRSCVGFRLVVEVHDGEGPTVLLQKDTCDAFAVRDDTGRAHVEGPFVLGLSLDGHWSPIGRKDAAILRQEDLSPNANGEPKLRYRENWLKVGDRVSVLGHAILEEDPTEPAAGFRSPAVRPLLRGTPDDPVFVAIAGPAVSR